jgi:hypothetical protein
LLNMALRKGLFPDRFPDRVPRVGGLVRYEEK